MSERKSYTHQEARRVAAWLRTEKGIEAHESFIARHKPAYYDFQPESLSTFNAIALRFKQGKLDPDYFDILLNHAHADDRPRFRRWIDAKLNQIAATQNNTSYEILDPVTPVPPDSPQQSVQPENTPVLNEYDHLPATHGKLYPNVVRAAHEVGMWAESQLWHIVRHVAPDTSGKVETATVRSFLTEQGYSDDKFYRVLNQGDGFWWTWDKVNGFIWYRQLDKIAMLLGHYIPQHRITEYRGTNAIGKPVYVSLIGNKQTFMRSAFEAWLEQRRKADEVTLANETMATVWVVSIRTIQRWKARCEAISNFAEQAPQTNTQQIKPDIPAHAVDTPSGGKLYQMANSYIPPADVVKHDHRGRSRNARKTFYRAMSIAHRNDSLSSIWDAEERSIEKRYWIHDDTDTAFVQVNKTLRKPESDTFLPRHVRLSTGKSIGIWETVTDIVQRVESVYIA